MQQLQYQAPHVLEWVEVPKPTLGNAGQALVRPLVVSRCELDRFIASGTLGWPGGFAFGHEIYGEVVAVGDGVGGFEPGDKVLVPFQISCGACARCLKGHTGLCESVAFRSCYGMAPLSGIDYGGGLSDLVNVPFADHMLVPVPDDVDPCAIAGVADNLTTAYSMVVEALAERPGASVLIVGGNQIALNAVRFAVASGAGDVVLIDEDSESLRLAAQLGADVVRAAPASATDSLGRYPITIDATGTAEGIACAIYSTDHEGFCQSAYGGFTETTPVPLRHMYGTNISLKLARVHARAHMPRVLACLRSACAHQDHMLPRQVPFAQAQFAMTEAAHGMVFVRDPS